MAKVFASIGECMVELSGAGDGLYRRGFAGDTLNTAWGVRGLSPDDAVSVRYVSRVGTDALSDEMVGFVAAAGIDTAHVGRDPARTVGLYMITLQGAERSFSYWRDAAAARRLAADRGALEAALADADMVYVSGITLAILPPEDRPNLFAALAAARARGAAIAFDANVRLRLWSDADAARAGLSDGYRAATIALPTHPDERDLFGDESPEATARRIAGLGVPEVVVKDGADPATLLADGALTSHPAERVDDAVDTTGAGDGFNAGYLAARLAGRSPVEAARLGHRVAARIIRSRGALIGLDALAAVAAGA